MARQPLRTVLVLASVAGSTVLAVALVPPTPWLAPEMHPLALTLSAGWATWRLLALDRALAQRRAWQQAPGLAAGAGMGPHARGPRHRDHPRLVARLAAPLVASVWGPARRPARTRLSLAGRAHAGVRDSAGH